MESKVFVDTDVIIDFLIDRQPYSQSATIIFDLADKKKLSISTSALCFNNIHYIVRKILGEVKTREVISELFEIVDVLSVSKVDLLNAIQSDIKDFKDAIQHSVAISDNSIKTIITRNTKDYKKSKISVFNSDTFIKMIKNER